MQFICVCLNAVRENGYQAHKNETDIPSCSSGLLFHSLTQEEMGEKKGGSGQNKVETKAPILLKEKTTGDTRIERMQRIRGSSRLVAGNVSLGSISSVATLSRSAARFAGFCFRVVMLCFVLR